MGMRLLVVDSGIGGLSVAGEIRHQAAAADIAYVADDAAFPYGGWSDGDLTAHVVALVERLVASLRPEVVVIACNTASTLVLPSLRDRLAIPVVGTVPAIKTAAEKTRSGLFSVLATPGTIQRDYTRDLIAEHAPDCRVRLVGSYELASFAEASLRGEPVAADLVRREIVDAFVEAGGQRTDAIVLGCTHYGFLLEVMKRLAPWPVRWIDAAPAIARRALSRMPHEGTGRGAGTAMLTSGRGWPDAHARLLAEIGLKPVASGI